jgi:hypothetical protein
MLTPYVKALSTGRSKKGRKIRVASAKMPAERDQIEVMPILRIGMQSNAD